MQKWGAQGVSGKTQAVCVESVAGWQLQAGGGMRGKHTNRFCAVFGLVLFEAGTDTNDLGQMLREEYVPCELLRQTRTVHSEV